MNHCHETADANRCAVIVVQASCLQLFRYSARRDQVNYPNSICDRQEYLFSPEIPLRGSLRVHREMGEAIWSFFQPNSEIAAASHSAERLAMTCERGWLM
ncbi:MAG: hypothetical protein ACLFWL_00415 [Candidatus Brocadiia bacterium]